MSGFMRGWSHPASPLTKSAGELSHSLASPIQAYRAAKACPSYKLKKGMGWAILGTGGLLYAGDKLTEDPDEKMVGAHGRS